MHGSIDSTAINVAMESHKSSNKYLFCIRRPDDTEWEGGTFALTMEFGEDYPSAAPKVKFVTNAFHPNVYGDGKLCLDILQKNWSPIYDVAAILTSIRSLLTDPNPDSPANPEAARLYMENRREYLDRVRKCVEGSLVVAGVTPAELEEAEAEGTREGRRAAEGGGGEGGEDEGSDSDSDSDSSSSSDSDSDSDEEGEAGGGGKGGDAP